MQLIRKIMILLVCLALAWLAGSGWVLISYVYPGFEQLELNHARQNEARVEAAFNVEQRRLRNFITDWAEWDHTYRYLQGRNDSFIVDNLGLQPAEALTDIDIDFMFIYDRQGQLVWGLTVEPESGQPVANDPFFSQPSAGGNHWQQLAQPVYSTGLVRTERGAALIGSGPVVDHNNPVDVAGWMVMGLHVDPAYIARLAARQQADISILPLAETEGGSYQDDTRRVTAKTLTGLDGEPALRVQIVTPRDITAKGKEVIGFSLIGLLLVTAGFLLVLLLLLFRYVARPLQALVDDVMQRAEPDHPGQAAGFRFKAEWKLLHDEYHRMLSRFQQASERIKTLAYRDSLTGLPNRMYFDQLLEETIELAQRRQRGFAVFFIDVDRLKGVNDEYGHRVGDLYLSKVASRMQQCLTRAGLQVCRLAGDEFTVLLPGVERQDRAEGIAERLLDVVSESFQVNESLTLTPSISVGITLYSPGDSAEQLLSKADQAMYRVKRGERGGFEFYGPTAEPAVDETAEA
ncbi:sensor domain-containing diguanylate cyclase [Marinobacterium arenosum]|uniref:sensor domain-containing diguanylate cyclase n=1 Tax=Marinobacterium arenosum TaxID=2862496 RepID=UPI001C9580B4|nr:diguanylate cyclase [Marinobacterium arenosum]MBY4676828.1 diguanylate cyclase [Marinobacterium arenosum]